MEITTLTGMDEGGAESSAVGSMLAMASSYLLMLRSEHKSRGSSGSGDVGVQESSGTNSFPQVQTGSFCCHVAYWHEE